MYVLGVYGKKKEEREVGTKNVFEEVMTKKTLSFMKTINPQMQAQQTANTRNMKKNIPKTIIIKQ